MINKNRKILAENDGFKLSVNRITGRLYYWYSVAHLTGESDDACEWSVLSECADFAQAWFAVEIKRLGLKIVKRETDTDYFDAINL